MKWFNECRTFEEVKATYKKLVKQYHLDLGSDTQTMQRDSDQQIKIFPFTFYQANVGLYQEPVSFMEGKIYRYDQQTQADTFKQSSKLLNADKVKDYEWSILD